VIEKANGDKEYLANGLRHRLDGPAIELANGVKSGEDCECCGDRWGHACLVRDFDCEKKFVQTRRRYPEETLPTLMLLYADGHIEEIL
jgi:hypothetical protein